MIHHSYLSYEFLEPKSAIRFVNKWYAMEVERISTRQISMILRRASLHISFVLGFLPPRFGASITLFMVGNILIAIIVASLLIKYAVQLIQYGKDTDANFAIGANE